ncbi:MAG: hypothetical protein KDB26_10955 [Microthrixaceae bacterium]|nr:hypothetical protein [Microthrixaceae bacterium]
MTNTGDAHIIKLRSAVTSPNIVLKTRYNVATEEYIVTGVKSVDWQPVWENMPEYMGTWTLLDAALDRFADAAKQFGERHAGTEERFLSDYISELDGWYSDTLELLEDALRQAADEFVETLN